MFLPPNVLSFSDQLQQDPTQHPPSRPSTPSSPSVYNSRCWFSSSKKKVNELLKLFRVIKVRNVEAYNLKFCLPLLLSNQNIKIITDTGKNHFVASELTSHPELFQFCRIKYLCYSIKSFEENKSKKKGRKIKGFSHFRLLNSFETPPQMCH